MKINIKLNKNNYREKSLSKKPFFEQGFTFLEFIFVVTLLGITSTLVIPFFKTSLNKSRQKEASFIVNSMIKSTQSYYGIYGYLPEDIWQLSKFSKYQKYLKIFLFSGLFSKRRLSKFVITHLLDFLTKNQPPNKLSINPGKVSHSN